jgi:hypothetical protein
MEGKSTTDGFGACEEMVSITPHDGIGHYQEQVAYAYFSFGFLATYVKTF